jgi:hypothetical protein
MSTPNPSSSPSVKPGAGAKAARPRGPQGPHLRGGSPDARRRAAAILEVLGGARTPTDAAVALGVTVPRYYGIEAQALEGLRAACEPRPRGRQMSPEREVGQLQRRVAQLTRDAARWQALVRASHRTVGLAAPPAPPKKAPGKRPRRPVTRALKAVARWQAEGGSGSPAVAPALAPQGPGPSGAGSPAGRV